MSITAMAWARKQRCGSGTQKAVLMVLADYANDEGRSYPRQKTLCEDTEFGERTIREALAALERQGKIRREERRRRDGTRTSDTILLMMGQPANAAAGEEDVDADTSKQAAASAGCGRINRHVAPEQPAAAAGLTSFEQPEEPKDRSLPTSRRRSEGGKNGRIEGRSDEEGAVAFLRLWPNPAATDSPTVIKREWAHLTVEERRLASEMASDWCAWATEGGLRVQSAIRYLRNRLWETRLLTKGRAVKRVFVPSGTLAMAAWQSYNLATFGKRMPESSNYEGKSGWWYDTPMPPGRHRMSNMEIAAHIAANPPPGYEQPEFDIELEATASAHPEFRRALV